MVGKSDPENSGYVPWKAFIGWTIGSGASWASIVVTIVFIAFNVQRDALHREVSNIEKLLDREHESVIRIERKLDQLLGK